MRANLQKKLGYTHKGKQSNRQIKIAPEKPITILRWQSSQKTRGVGINGTLIAFKAATIQSKQRESYE